MGMIYASIPLIGGYCAYLYVCQKRIENLGKHHETLIATSVPNTTSGNNSTIDGKSQQHSIGVKLTVSDAEDQRRNKHMLQAYLRQQQRRYGQRQQQQEKEVESTTVPQ